MKNIEKQARSIMRNHLKGQELIREYENHILKVKQIQEFMAEKFSIKYGRDWRDVLAEINSQTPG